MRLARQIAHTNVCRVYDVGETEGRHFISMEFVDGEDLATLLRRIGHLPQDKGVQIARELCMGLAAAHAQGILHRDLKPSNVMLDGRGRARITDFGLAALAGQIGVEDTRAGTPAYMAPEQLSGREVTARSDIYSLGLVLYELFTGRPAFSAVGTTPPSPSSGVAGLDPAVEQAVLRCLAREPRERPASALAVAAALPGGDPLAAALAAGETPSPEMVADAESESALRPAVGVSLLTLILAGLFAWAFVAPRNSLLSQIALEKPTEALVADAREILQEAGCTGRPADSAVGYLVDSELVEHVEETDSSPERWKRLATVRPAPVHFWYRQSPLRLVPSNKSGIVYRSDPPESRTGMASVRLDTHGRLIELLVVPPSRDGPDHREETPEWGPLLRRAGLEPKGLRPVLPTWHPRVDCDTRIAWEGAYENQPDVALHIEACGATGRPAWFRIVYPWEKPPPDKPWTPPPFQRVVDGLFAIVILLMLVCGGLLARRNLRLGRGDRKAAFRMAGCAFVASFAAFVLRADHTPNPLRFFLDPLPDALLAAAATWLLYVAMEPYVRRHWPHALITWSRLVALGRLRDPLVGRDILVGGAACVTWLLISSIPVREWIGRTSLAPSWARWELTALEGVRQLLGVHVQALLLVLLLPMGLFFLVLLLRMVLRRAWLASLLVLALVVLQRTVTSDGDPVAVLLTVSFFATMLFVLVRFGLLAAVFLQVFLVVPSRLVPLADLSSWYAVQSLIPLFALAALAVWGFHLSRAGRPILDGLLGEDSARDQP